MNNKHEVSSFRRYLPQVIASTVKNFLLLDLGLSVAFPSIVIPALTGFPNEFNQNEQLSMSPSEASWFASMAFIFQPIGSIVSSLITDPLGRRRAMFIVNIPHVIAWYMMYNATSISAVFFANMLLGLGVGLMEAPILTYVGEISEPSIRGILTACASISATLGLLVVHSLNTEMGWRTVGLVCLTVPLVTMLAVCFIPETPLWLLSKNRVDEAEKALCWLRGWVPAAAVSTEFTALQRYNERSKSCNTCIKQNILCSHPAPNFVEKVSELKRKRTLKPFIIVMTLFFLYQFASTAAIRPYLVQIMQAYHIPIRADRALVISSTASNVATIIFIGLVRVLGKRGIYMIASAGTLLSSLALSIYGYLYLPSGTISFGHQAQPYEYEETSFNYIPLVLITCWNFFSSAGVISLPWMLLSEIFPFKSRGMATGLAAAMNYILGFFATKTYYNLELWLSIPGATLFYCIINIFGWIVMYFILPETEDRTLEDIELHFSDNNRKLTDRNIAKFDAMSKAENLKGNEAAKSISTISSIIETDWQQKFHTAKTGCDNEGFSIESTKC